MQEKNKTTGPLIRSLLAIFIKVSIVHFERGTDASASARLTFRNEHRVTQASWKPEEDEKFLQLNHWTKKHTPDYLIVYH